MINIEVLIYETKQSCREYLPKLISASDRLVELIQAGNPWSELFEGYTKGLSWVNSAIESIKKANGDELKEINLTELNSLLIEANNALINRDYILLADIIQYELKALLEKYLTAIKEVVHLNVHENKLERDKE